MNDKQNLINRLMDAVKQCQIRFGGRKALATDVDSSVCCLCQQLENILQHGLRQPEEAPNALRQIRDAVADGLSMTVGLPGLDKHPVVFWHFVRGFLTRDEFERYLLLINVSTDMGRGRSWLRSALNESSLERYIHCLVNDTEAISKYYEDWSLFADPECNAMLPNIVAGLGSVLFAISIDQSDLDGVARRVPVVVPSATATEPRAVVSCTSPLEIRSHATVEGRRRLRRRRVEPQQCVTSLEEEEESVCVTVAPPWRSAPATCVNSPAVIGGSTMRFPFADSTLVDSSGDELSRSVDSGSCSGVLSSGLVLAPVSGVHSAIAGPFTPLRLSNCPPGGATVRTTGSLNGTARSWDSVSCSDSDTPVLVSNPQDSVPPDTAPLTEAQLREALETVFTQKKCLNDQLTDMKSQLLHLQEDNERLRATVDADEQRYEERLSRSESEREAVEKENSTLKQQLKKYVTAVQMLRHDPGQQPPLEDSEDVQPVLEHQQQSEADLYQQKLLQVADMHAELMEFNSRLRARLCRRQRRMSAMAAELASLRGRRPEDYSSDGDDIVSSTRSQRTDDRALEDSPQRVHVWVPSVFTSSTGGRQHHTYQVYLRVCDDEWNVYQRYSSFYQLYRRLRKVSRDVRTFDFPPKRVINKLDSGLAEKRRQRLQEFLRCVIRYLIQSKPELSTNPCRAALLLAEPFFGAESETSPAPVSWVSRSPTAVPVTSPGAHTYAGL